MEKVGVHIDIFGLQGSEKKIWFFEKNSHNSHLKVLKAFSQFYEVKLDFQLSWK